MTRQRPMTTSHTAQAQRPISTGTDSGARVLVIGADGPTRDMLSSLLRESEHACAFAPDAGGARGLMSSEDFAVVLADVDTEGSSILELAKEVVRDHEETAVFIITQRNDKGLVKTALDMGVYGYMVKPLEPNEVVINIANALRRRDLEIENADHRDRLQRLVRERNSDLWDAVARLEAAKAELRASREETIERLSIAAEFRDNETRRHIKRIGAYSELLARASGMDEEHCDMIRVASHLHDVGKIGIPDSILKKPGKLTDEERHVMERHTEIGYRILSGSSSEILSIAASIALTHHERYDGGGYPRRLRGEDIPMEGRIMAVADVFDGLTSHRVYKDAVSLPEALDVMRTERKKQLDPDLVDFFLGSIEAVLEVKARDES
jgi:putative two-component system response regulator